ncbi:MAG TPA: 50S ribosomal protein L18 [Desulfobacteraceae bacterium]|jgi:large subunit ribosomal protein L18|nr:50S ribosomal protein L18 [Desulfobacteraceae bacterium]HPJ66714.1 50S ribosomal protein L18 [Desulfobacteraceae bacterium]HPQ26925.1 50S ribosomal protein L18 [Desulfobacteraceae bacterium]
MGGISRSLGRLRRKKRVRKNVKGTSDKPRLCVFRSSKHIYAQIIDDSKGITLAAASSLSKDVSAKSEKNSGNREGAALIGATIADQAIKKGIKKVVFDRNGFLYHGRVKALSEGAREHGLEF